MKSVYRGLAILLFLPSICAAGPLQAGAATSNITPSLGQEIIGGFLPFPATHIHDELHVRCLVLDDGDTRLALVVCDLLGIDRQVSELARKQIEEQHGIPASHVLISATHTHSATSALGKERRKLNQPPDTYQLFVVQRIVDGVARAIQQLRPAELAHGTAHAPEHVFNRRWHMRPGSIPPNPFGGGDLVRMNPPRASDNLLEPAGPTDPAVSFLAIREPNGRPIALYAAYSLHYVGGVGRGHVSADYFAVFSETLRRQLLHEETDDMDRPDVVVMMANGTSGDINNINFRQKRPARKRYQQMRLVGQDVAGKVYAAMDSVNYQSDVSLAAVYREPVVSWRKITADQKQWAEEMVQAGPQKKQDLSYLYAQRVQMLADYPETTTVPLQVLRIGDVTIGTMPFEVFCETGLAFRDQCSAKLAFLVELSHGYFGYLPTPRQRDLGGYETWLGTNLVERDASEKLLATLLEMAGELD